MIASHTVRACALAALLAGCAGAPPERAPAGRGLAGGGPIDLHIVALNDFHGNLEPSKYTYTPAGSGQARTVQAGGIAVLGGALAAFRHEDPNLLFVAAGDLVGASPALSSMWADEPSIVALDRMGLVASSLGNHEFDQGSAELLRQQHGGCASPRPAKACRLAPDFKGAGFSYLAANVRDARTGATLVPGWRIVDVKGVKVGLIGAVLKDTASVATAAAIRGLAFGDEADAINAVLPAMRAKGAQVFVVLVHEGGMAQDAFDQADCATLHGPIVGIAQRLDPAIRLVISGHSHTGYLCKVGDKVVTQADAAGHLLSRITISVDTAGGAGRDAVVRNIVVRNVVMDPAVIAPDAALAGYLDEVRGRSRAELARPVARIAAPVSRHENAAGESALGGVIADAALAAAREGGAQVAFMNSGGIRKDLDAGEGGVVSFGQAQAVLPFGNTLVLMDLSGAQLRAVLEQQWQRPATSPATVLQVSSNLSYRWNAARPPGQRIVPGSLRVDGVAVEDGRRYRIAANNFLAEGGDSFPAFAQGGARVETQTRDLDALIAYLKQHPETGASGIAGQKPRIVKEP